MVQVWLRVGVWVMVFGIAYLMFGPQFFDGSRSANPVGSHTQLYLPPAKSMRETELAQLAEQGRLDAAQQAEYVDLREGRQARFWQGDGTSVEQALAGVATQRKAHLAALLRQRGLSDLEAGLFMMAVERDYPRLLEDRQ